MGKLGPVTCNVHDGHCLSLEIYVLGELEASFNVDINVLLKRLVLTFKQIFIYLSF
jgi:hypothetical protein